MTIFSGNARLAGITGWPVGHSRSPRLHGFWLERHGIDGAYVPLPIDPANFPAAVRGLASAGFAGVNVTIPHKVAAFAICDKVEESARRAGAVNTLVFDNGRIAGSNTDGWGFLENLRAHGCRSGRRPGVDPGRRRRGARGRGGAAGLGRSGDGGEPHTRPRRVAGAGTARTDGDRLGARGTAPCPITRCWSTRPRLAWPAIRRWRSISTGLAAG